MDGGAGIEAGKMFVGGLSWETTKERLEAYFSRFGEVSDSVIMMDPITKRPRGFGFVTFADPASVTKVLQGGEHIIDNKKVDPKQATTKNETAPAPSAQAISKKVFIGGIAAGTTESDVREYFSTYGIVTEVDLKHDKDTQKLRGFGFVAFESQEIADRVCADHFHQIKGKSVEAKKAEPRYGHPRDRPIDTSGSWGTPGYTTAGNYGYGVRSAGAYGAYTGYGYGYGGQQQQQHQQQQQYGQYYGYGASSYGGQGYSQFPQTSAGYDRGFYSAQQTGTTGQQQGYGQDSTGYGRTAYAGTEAYSGTPGTAGYSYDTTAAANSFQQYGDNQASGYGRGVATQQRSMGSYQQQQQQQPYTNTH